MQLDLYYDSPFKAEGIQLFLRNMPSIENKHYFFKDSLCSKDAFRVVSMSMLHLMLMTRVNLLKKCPNKRPTNFERLDLFLFYFHSKFC